MQQQAIDWSRDVDAPISGSTPAARHASASGAMAAVTIRGRVTRAILGAFLRNGRLTIAETSFITGIREPSVCSCWNRLERIGWIVGTGVFDAYELNGRLVKRELHELTERGREMARQAQQQELT